ncbi:hypothetical protein FO440_12285 [Mucilaginibacter corticis]|uniref:Uncharacterized protein n=1 Tax=Mucilaginibacter corticis TaxID=2597670 RepID=A0A556MKT0_9SPHI|nr:hypothetical protein [Mucilaginibacter corticis]TSJ40526.1 hypothetical protein FO440_12285 [Mucilaginibacter corticis]
MCFKILYHKSLSVFLTLVFVLFSVGHVALTSASAHPSSHTIVQDTFKKESTPLVGKVFAHPKITVHKKSASAVTASLIFSFTAYGSIKSEQTAKADLCKPALTTDFQKLHCIWRI